MSTSGWAPHRQLERLLATYVASVEYPPVSDWRPLTDLRHAMGVYLALKENRPGLLRLVNTKANGEPNVWLEVIEEADNYWEAVIRYANSPLAWGGGPSMAQAVCLACLGCTTGAKHVPKEYADHLMWVVTTTNGQLTTLMAGPPEGRATEPPTVASNSETVPPSTPQSALPTPTDE